MTADTVVDLTPDRPTVELRGRRFRVREQGVSLLTLMKFATVAKRGLSTEDMEGLAALYELLTQCIDPADWSAFETHAAAVGAREELMFVVRDAITAMQAAQGSARPTQPPSRSPHGLPTTAANSAAGSSSPGWSGPVVQGDRRVQADLEARGRPDLALVVKRAREASPTSSTG